MRFLVNLSMLLVIIFVKKYIIFRITESKWKNLHVIKIETFAVILLKKELIYFIVLRNQILYMNY